MFEYISFAVSFDGGSIFYVVPEYAAKNQIFGTATTS